MRRICLSVLIISPFFIGCSTDSSKNKMPAIFNTKAEAEQAAKNFNCTGAHKMGDKWMPCKSHDAHQEGEKHQKYGDSSHHNH